jgi:hypothetical protein
MVEPARAPAEAAAEGDEQRKEPVMFTQLEDQYGSLEKAWGEAGFSDWHAPPTDAERRRFGDELRRLSELQHVTGWNGDEAA